MQQTPIGYQVKGFLSGFSALYAIFVVGCVVAFILALVLMPDSWERDVLIIVFGIGFIGLITYAIIRERKHPETFATKQIQEISITIVQQLKSPTEKRPRNIVSTPIPRTLENQKDKIKRLKS